MNYHRRHDDPASWQTWACCFVIALCLLAMILILADSIDKEAVYDRAKLDNHLSPAQRAEIMGRTK